MTFTRRHHAIAIATGLGLLFLCGGVAGFGADLQRNWVSRGRFGAVGPDWHKSALLLIGQTVPLIPACFLVGRRRMLLSSLTYIGGIGGWLLLSELSTGLVAQNTVRGRCFAIGASFVIFLMVAMYVHKHARTN